MNEEGDQGKVPGQRNMLVLTLFYALIVCENSVMKYDVFLMLQTYQMV